MDFKLQLGGKGAHPQELTLVSDWGKLASPTTLWLERRKISTPFSLLWHGRP